MERPTTLRLPKEMLREIRKISEVEYLDSSTTIRKLLAEAIKEWRLKNALENLRNGKISIGKASEKAGISIFEIINLAKENHIDWVGYTEKDLERDLKFLKNIK